MRTLPPTVLATLACACFGPTSEPPAVPGGEAGQPPAPGEPLAPAGGAPAQGFSVTAGEGVTLSGTLTYAGTRTGTLRIDFLPADPAAAMPGAAHTLMLDAPGPWSVDAPRDFGALQICAFLDENGDGPSPGEPKVMLAEPLTIAATPIEGLSLVIEDDWDAKHMQTPPGGVTGPAPAEAAPAGAPATEGTQAPAGAPAGADAPAPTPAPAAPAPPPVGSGSGA